LDVVGSDKSANPLKLGQKHSNTPAMGKPMKVLLIGGGGREHALGWKICQSPLVRELLSAPGNPGLAALGRCIAIDAEDIAALFALAIKEQPDLVVIGPEVPLTEGLADQLRGKGIAVFGPSAAAARLEGSKAFTKAFCTRHNIPTAGYKAVQTLDEAKAYLQTLSPPFVLKADGLAAGKGVVIADDIDAAIKAARSMLDGQFGAASQTLVIEEFLHGEEASFFALSDGEAVLPLITAQDHKRAFDGDKGPNTGGMGAFSPVPHMDNLMTRRVMDEIIMPTIAGMRAEGHGFSGVLFAGLMIGDDGPKLIEYNVRFGDPECQVLMMRLQSDLVPLMLACAKGSLADAPPPIWDERACATVVMAAKGYPGAYQKHIPLDLPAPERPSKTTQIFQAGTMLDEHHHLISTGGRVLAVTALADNSKAAAQSAYQLIEQIDFPGGFYRRDIGARV
jgi:phosphoribosylamine---glycine ligase